MLAFSMPKPMMRRVNTSITSSACAARAEELGAGHQKVDEEDEELAHLANTTINTSPCKTPRRGRIPSHYEFAPNTSTDLLTRLNAAIATAQATGSRVDDINTASSGKRYEI